MFKKGDKVRFVNLEKSNYLNNGTYIGGLTLGNVYTISRDDTWSNNYIEVDEYDLGEWADCFELVPQNVNDLYREAYKNYDHPLFHHWEHPSPTNRETTLPLTTEFNKIAFPFVSIGPTMDEIRREGSYEQPDPIPNASTPICDLVIEDLKKRMELGKQRYGTPLQAHNGRDALQDVYEELLDACQYLKQAIIERDSK